ncbi:hypothetical protein JTB14_016437 [Gonioctena quinquepunctata]|nr:hypothetical protein JTB14_016437 [Gonioctena quinquepunctata]
MSYTRHIFLTPVSDSIPKCCEYHQWLVLENRTVFCNKTYSDRVKVRANSVLDKNITENAQCVEVFKSEISLFDFENVIFDRIFEKKNDVREENAAVYFSKTGERFSRNRYCLDETIDHRYTVRVCEDLKICEQVRCIHKCCADGKSFINGSHCKDTFIHGLDFQFVKSFVGNYSDDFAIIHGYPGKVFLDPSISEFSLDRKGHFHNGKTDEIFPPEKPVYCIEHATKRNRTLSHKYFGQYAGASPPLTKKFVLNRVAMIISGIFLIVTMIFYIFTRETKKVFGKALVGFCFTLLMLYGCLVYYTFKRDLHYKNNKFACKTIGFSIIYLGFSCFTWLQIMCFDIYWAFGSSKKYTSYSEKRTKELKRFILYSLHGWGSPLAITILLSLFHYVDVLPLTLEIKMGVTKCTMEKGNGNYAEILFRTVPLTIIQVLNLVLFFKTVAYCLKVKADIKKMNQTALNIKKKKKFFARRARFGLVVKLSFTMGIFYLFEVVSSFFDFDAYKATSILEIIWDFINCSQGLFIFLIFVCKKKNYIKCKESAAMEKIRKVSLSSTMTTSLSHMGRKISNVTRRTSRTEET